MDWANTNHLLQSLLIAAGCVALAMGYAAGRKL